MKNMVMLSLWMVVWVLGVGGGGQLSGSTVLAQTGAAELVRTPPNRFEGPFRSDALSFYLVHHGGHLSVQVYVQTDTPVYSLGYDRSLRNAFVLRFFDADENLRDWSFHRFEDRDGPRKVVNYSFGDSPAGIYQVRFTGSMSHNMQVDIRSRPAVSFGILPMRTQLYTTAPEQFASAYFYIPPGADQDIPTRPLRAVTDRGHLAMLTNAASGQVLNEAGEQVAELRSGRRVSLSVAEHQGEVWQLQLPGMRPAGHVFFGQGGAFDMILCPDPQTARNIRGNVHVTDDGRVFPHRFQARMWQWMQSLTEADLAVHVQPEEMLARESAWMNQPRNLWLLGPWGAFSNLRHILANQTVEQPVLNRHMSGALAVAYALNEPLNPYYGDPGIANRLLLAEFGRWIGVRESGALMDTWHGHSGGDAFYGDMMAYGYAGPLLREHPMYDLWTQGVRYFNDRFVHQRMSPENQSAHWLLIQHYVHVGSGLDEYAPLVDNFAQMFLDPRYNGKLNTGYTMESYGPDATYQGLAANHIARFYRLTGNELARQALEKIYNLFNHTVAPEPDGRMLGTSHFSHRTPGTWVQRQYGGGTITMAGDLPSAAAWHQNLDQDDPEYIEQANQEIREELRAYFAGSVVEPARSFSDYRFKTRYIYHPEEILPGQFPVVAESHFDRQFNDQFHMVRRPDYYAFVYTGKPDPDVSRIRSRELPEQIQRRTGGGLSMFWTPAFGSAVLSQNWSAYTNQMIRVDRTGDDDKLQVDWPDYYSLESEYQAGESPVLRTTSSLMHLPVQVERQTTFAPDHVRQHLQLTTPQRLAVDRMVEQLPFPVKPSLLRDDADDDSALNVWFHVDGQWTRQDGLLADAVWLGDQQDQGVLIVFERAAVVTLGPIRTGARGRADTQVSGQRHGLIEIRLDDDGYIAEQTDFSYRLIPGPRDMARLSAAQP